MQLLNKPTTLFLSTSYDMSFSDMSDSNIYNQTLSFLDDTKNVAGAYLGTLTELSSEGTSKNFRLKLLTEQLVYVRIKGIDYPFRGHILGVNSSEFPRYGQDTYFPLKTPTNTIRIKEIKNGSGLTVMANGFISPKYNSTEQTSGGSVRIGVNSVTGDLAYHSFQIVTEEQGTPFYNQILVQCYNKGLSDVNYFDVYVKVWRSENGVPTSELYPVSFTVPILNVEYKIFGDENPEFINEIIYDAQFIQIGTTNEYKYRFTISPDYIISMIEIMADHVSSTDSTVFKMTENGHNLRLKYGDAPNFYYDQSNNPPIYEFNFYVELWKRELCTIVGGENIIEKTWTVYVNTFGIDVNYVARKLGAGSLKVGVLCTHNNINKWSRCKPVRLSKSGAVTLSDITSAQQFTIPSGAGATEIILSQVWEYLRPRGNSAEPYRIADFRNYLHTAIVPITITLPASIPAGGANTVVSMINTVNSTPPAAENAIDPANYAFPGANVYFGVMVKNGTSHQYKTGLDTIQNGGTSVSLSGCSLLTSGSAVELYCFYCTTSIPDFISSTSVVLYSMQLEAGIANKTYLIS